MKVFFDKIKVKADLILSKFLALNFCKKFAVLNKKRNDNSTKYKMTNFLLMFMFPLFIVCLAEINQMKTPAKFILFISQKPAVMLFNILFAALLFTALFFLLKKGILAVLVMGITYFALSTVELFKFNTSGNHLIATDMKMAVNVENVARFAYIKITPALVIYFILLIAYFVVVFWFNPVLKIKALKRMFTSGICIASGIVAVVSPTIAMPLYAFFDIDTTQADNVFKVNEKFNNNNFLAFFVETATENLNKEIAVPENYTEDTIDNILDDTTAVNAVLDTQTNTLVQPNVITVMSEAFTDFRRFEELGVSDEYYADWDSVTSEGYLGEAVVPTFASFTVRTEFELNFGLPVKSLNDPNMPQRILLDRAQPAIAQYYSDLGYHTDYLHTFAGSFYSRQRVYANFGFDNLIFEDDFSVPVEYEGSYISDSVIFNQIIDILKQNTDAPTFIHTTTMEDHQPYDVEGKTELEAYLDRVQTMLSKFKTFTEQLKDIDRPTVVLFIGDHLPCFKGEGNAYSQLNIDSNSCGDLYEQPYLVWSNYDLDYSQMPSQTVSAFYLPYVVMDTADIPTDSFINTMLDKMQEVPIYSTSYDDTIPSDELLDMLTYDRVLGDKLSDNTSSTEKDLANQSNTETTTETTTSTNETTKEAA